MGTGEARRDNITAKTQSDGIVPNQTYSQVGFQTFSEDGQGLRCPDIRAMFVPPLG
jgi:hypothetical protein